MIADRFDAGLWIGGFGIAFLCMVYAIGSDMGARERCQRVLRELAIANQPAAAEVLKNAGTCW